MRNGTSRVGSLQVTPGLLNLIFHLRILVSFKSDHDIKFHNSLSRTSRNQSISCHREILLLYHDDVTHSKRERSKRERALLLLHSVLGRWLIDGSLIGDG